MIETEFCSEKNFIQRITIKYNLSPLLVELPTLSLHSNCYSILAVVTLNSSLITLLIMLY